MDTRNKRASALGFALAALVILPAPDATVSQDDRQQAAFSYSGIAAGAAIPDVLSVINLTGSYSPLVTLTGSYAASISVTGSYQATIGLTGSVE